MRASLAFLGLILAALAAMTLLAYPAWLLLSPHFDFPFHRIANRIGMLALLAGFIVVARRMKVADRRSLGYALPRRRFLAELCKALVIGAAMMGALVALMALLGLRDWKTATALTPSAYALLSVKALLSGLTVAFIEETFLRGAMFTAVRRESSIQSAVLLTALVYSALHFFARMRIAADDVTWMSGVDLLQGTLQTFTDPLAIADAYLCLFAVGILLGLVREATGNIAACIGLHAGWVWVMLITRETTIPDRSQELSFLLSAFDGFVGWLVLAWTVVMGLALQRFYAGRPPA